MLAHASILLGFVLILFTPAYVLGASAQSATADKGQRDYVVMVGDKPYPIKYAISGGSVKSIAADAKTATVSVYIQADSDGELQLRLPGSFQRKVFSQSDGELVVFVDQTEDFAKDATYDCYRAITATFSAGRKQIDIVGTFPLSSATAPTNDNYSFTTKVSAEGTVVQLPLTTNTDECTFSFVKEEKKLHADIVGPEHMQSFFQVGIPSYFIGGNYTALINGEPAKSARIFPNPVAADVTTISLTYDGNTTKSIDIVGTSAVPEFNTVAILVAALSIAGVIFVNRSKL